jgi:hypothetical protein
MLSAPGITRYAPLEDAVHAHIYPDRPGGLIDAVEAALSQKPALKLMAERARRHVLAYHTHARICEHIAATSLEIIQRDAVA